MTGSGERVRVLCIGGSTRPGSSSELALRVAAGAAQEAGGDVELVSGRELLLPIYDTETTERVRPAARLIAAARKADAVIVSSPGYHGVLSGMVKNALDYLEDLRDDARSYLDGVPVGCIGVAHGWQAAVSTLQGLRSAVHALRGWPSPLGSAVNASGKIFDGAGKCTDDVVRAQLETVAAQVVEFAVRNLRAQRWAAAGGSSVERESTRRAS